MATRDERYYPFRIVTAVGNRLIGYYGTLAQARKRAAAISQKTPVEIWTTVGGSFGVGKFVEDYDIRKKNPLPVGRSKSCHIRRLRNGKYQVRI